MGEEKVTVREAAQMLGCSDTYIYELVRSGKVRRVDGGRRGKGQQSTVMREDISAWQQKRVRQAEERARRLKELSGGE